MGGKKKSSKANAKAEVVVVDPAAKAAAAEFKKKGNTAFVANKFADAVNHFTMAIAEDPTDHVFYSNRSACYASLNEIQKARDDAEKCVSLKPEWPKGYSRLGLACFKGGDFAAAQKAYAAGLVLEPTNDSFGEGLEEVRNAKKAQVAAQVAKARADQLAEEMAKKAGVDPSCIGGAKPEHVIGIDLGTTYSCVAVWRNGEADVLANEEGERTTPSWAAFTAEGERLVGDAAKRQAAMNPTRTMNNIKRIIGRQYSDCTEEIKRMTFDVVEGAGGRPMVKLDVAGETRTYAPEQVSALVLEKMKAVAEMALGEPVTKAVVTVPAYFNDAQRRLTQDAGTIAGLQVLRVINEPTAAALAYGLDKANQKGAQTILVFDLGGGTFDVSLLRIEDGVFEVMSTSGDTHLGGEDFDSAIADWAVADIKKKQGGNDIFKDNLKAIRRLRAACERAKRQLSSSMTAGIEFTVGDVEVDLTLSRAKFEKLCEPHFQRCLESVKRALDDAKLKKDQVDELVLVGGSTRVPRVQAILQDYFSGKQLNKSVHPDEAVAFGAAVQGAILAGTRDPAMQQLLLVDVIPLSLGVECEGRHFAKVVSRNTSVPCKKSSEFTTVEDFQTEIDVRIFEGERQNTDGNNLLGEFQITGVERAKRGEAKILVTFEVNTSGLLAVTACDKVTGAKANVEIQRGPPSDDEVTRMVAEAERYREEDDKRRKEFEAAQQAEWEKEEQERRAEM